jgi:hypothetical protein
MLFKADLALVIEATSTKTRITCTFVLHGIDTGRIANGDRIIGSLRRRERALAHKASALSAENLEDLTNYLDLLLFH